MTRKSSGAPTTSPTAVPSTAEVQAATRIGSTDYAATDLERRLRARYWAECRSDPLRRAGTPTLDTVCAIVKSDAPQKLWARPGFREWFLRERDVEEKAEFLLDIWTEEMDRRMIRMSDKDFIQAGKLLLEIVTTNQERTALTDPLAGLTPEQLVEKLGPILQLVQARSPK